MPEMAAPMTAALAALRRVAPDDLSERRPFVNDQGQVDGVEHRTSYLMNSLLSHKSRRYGRWTLQRFVNEVGTSQFVAFSERDAVQGVSEFGYRVRHSIITHGTYFIA